MQSRGDFGVFERVRGSKPAPPMIIVRLIFDGCTAGGSTMTLLI